MSFPTLHATIEADGVNVFYRSAGNPSCPVLLLLHGFPSSSFQFRNLIPLLSHRYHVIAPDLPGFGFTIVPEARNYKYTFDNLASTIEAFVDVLQLKKFAIYVFDYGAPTGFRLATRRPSQITGIISQNGNAYEEGLGAEFWTPVRKYWASAADFDQSLGTAEAQALVPFFALEPTAAQYTTGVPPALLSRVDPSAYTFDTALIQRPGQQLIQLSLFFDYQTNLRLYPKWQEYLRKEKPKLLAMWGENDPIFTKAGAQAFKKDLPDAEVVFVDSGHFALETHLHDYARKIDGFLSKA
ncbi:alpha/beta hydrolase fold protein [Gautieria morchelliformis]|nr:alpha/beta hydrolase fold protein [Gautieria morchelliformis]